MRSIMTALAIGVVLGCGASAQTVIEAPFAAPATPGVLRVNNRKPVELRVTGVNPYNECKVDKKREAIEPEDSLISALLDLFAPIGLPLPAASPLDFQAPAASPGGRAMELIKAAAARQSLVAAQINAKAAYFRIVGQFTKSLIRADNEKDFTARQPAVVKALDEAVNPFPPAGEIPQVEPVVSTGCGKAEFKACEQDLANVAAELRRARLPALNFVELSTAVAQRYVRDQALELEKDPVQFAKIGAALDQLTSTTAALKAALTALEKKVASLTEFAGVTRSLDPSFTQTFTFVLDRNAKVTGTVSCVSRLSQDPTMDPVSFTIVYQDLPHFSLAAGLIISSVDRHSYSVEAQADSTTTTAEKLKYKIADDNSSVQVVIGMKPASENARAAVVNTRHEKNVSNSQRGPETELRFFRSTVGIHADPGRPVHGDVLKTARAPSEDPEIHERERPLPVTRAWKKGFCIQHSLSDSVEVRR